LQRLVYLSSRIVGPCQVLPESADAKVNEAQCDVMSHHLADQIAVCVVLVLQTGLRTLHEWLSQFLQFVALGVADSSDQGGFFIIACSFNLLVVLDDDPTDVEFF